MRPGDATLRLLDALAGVVLLGLRRGLLGFFIELRTRQAQRIERFRRAEIVEHEAEPIVGAQLQIELAVERTPLRRAVIAKTFGAEVGIGEVVIGDADIALRTAGGSIGIAAAAGDRKSVVVGKSV